MLISFVCISCGLIRGMTLKIPIGRRRYLKPRFKIESLSPKTVEVFILLLSLTALCLLLLTSGGVSSPFAVYLGSFPVVISMLTNYKWFVWLTVILTFVVAVVVQLYAEPMPPLPGHEMHLAIATLIIYAISLAFTATLIIEEMNKDGGN